MITRQTTRLGRTAEQSATHYLERAGYDIVDRNWRRRECEIDIVARRDGTIYFVEVKYRSRDGHGSGLEHIDARKLRRMSYAASRWVAEHGWYGQYALAAIEVSGHNYQVTAFVDTII